MLYDRMLYEKQQLINRINLNKEKLKTLPEGTLYCVNQKWYYKVKGKKERYPMFHIVSPGELNTENISIEDLYLPIERR